MASLARTKYLGPGPALRKKETAAQRSKVSPDYLALAILLMLMLAIMALAMWLASMGGEAVQPVDYWMLMP